MIVRNIVHVTPASSATSRPHHRPRHARIIGHVTPASSSTSRPHHRPRHARIVVHVTPTLSSTSRLHRRPCQARIVVHVTPASSSTSSPHRRSRHARVIVHVTPASSSTSRPHHRPRPGSENQFPNRDCQRVALRCEMVSCDAMTSRFVSDLFTSSLCSGHRLLSSGVRTKHNFLWKLQEL